MLRRDFLELPIISESEVESLQLSVFRLFDLLLFRGVTAFCFAGFAEADTFTLLLLLPANRESFFLETDMVESLDVDWEALTLLLVRMHPDTLYLLEFIFITMASSRVPLLERIGSFFSFKLLSSAFAFPFM